MVLFHWYFSMSWMQQIIEPSNSNNSRSSSLTGHLGQTLQLPQAVQDNNMEAVERSLETVTWMKHYLDLLLRRHSLRHLGQVSVIISNGSHWCNITICIHYIAQWLSDSLTNNKLPRSILCIIQIFHEGKISGYTIQLLLMCVHYLCTSSDQKVAGTEADCL